MMSVLNSLVCEYAPIEDMMDNWFRRLDLLAEHTTAPTTWLVKEQIHIHIQYLRNIVIMLSVIKRPAVFPFYQLKIKFKLGGCKK
jgi:hypothetical protein